MEETTKSAVRSTRKQPDSDVVFRRGWLDGYSDLFDSDLDAVSVGLEDERAMSCRSTTARRVVRQ